MTNKSLVLSTIPLLDSENGRKVVEELCGTHKVPKEILLELVKMELNFIGYERRHGINSQITEFLNSIQEED